MMEMVEKLAGSNQDYPAFRFYLKEGFVVDKEVEFEGVKLCHMRLALE